MNIVIDRMIRAARLDEKLYEEVEVDKGAMGQAIGVVLLSSAAAGVGGISKGGISGGPGGSLCSACGLVPVGLSYLPYRYQDTPGTPNQD